MNEIQQTSPLTKIIAIALAGVIILILYFWLLYTAFRDSYKHNENKE